MSSKSKQKKKRLNFKIDAPANLPSNRIALGTVLFNEAKRVEEWLDRHSFVERIVIIDQGSTDGTVKIVKSYPNVEFYPTNRFEHFGEHDFNNLIDVAGKDGMMFMGVDEFISKELYDNLTKRVFSVYKRFSIVAFYIARKNMVEGICVNHLFKTAIDPDGKDWQLRIALGRSIELQNSTHTQPIAKGKFAYIHDDIYLTHEKTLVDEEESIRKRALQNNDAGRKRDIGYLATLKKMIAEKEQTNEKAE